MVDQTATVIVALPQEDDYVWKVSSEEKPHLTLLYLGDSGSISDLTQVTKFVEHVSNLSLKRFYLSVDHRGELGDDKADVLFFDKNYMTKELQLFRSYLLKDDTIAKLYNSTDQFSEWTPHLTLGYPASPAKKLDRDYPIYSVEFDRIALWTGNFEGPEFLLNKYVYTDGMGDVAMSVIDNALTHHGVKGMKWGVRRRSSMAKLPSSDDFKRAQVAKSKVTKGKTHALSNDELQSLVKRMNLEKQYKDLSSRDKKKIVGAKLASDIIGGVAKQQATRLANDAATQQINSLLKKAKKS